MKKLLVLFYFILLIFQFATAQNVGIGTNTPQAALEVSSTTNGFLPPRMTYVQRNDIVNPEKGVIVFCLDCGDNGGELQYYNGSAWLNMIGAAAQVPNTTVNLPSVIVGTQTWSSKNLDVAKYRNGESIPEVADPLQWSNLTTGAWCWYNNDSTNYAALYGRLYNWYAVNDPRGLAPAGWHVPTDAEWNKLIKYIDTEADTTCAGCIQSSAAGGNMKSVIGWNSPNTGANNSSGFSALPAGIRDVTINGEYTLDGYSGYWWSTNEYNTPPWTGSGWAGTRFIKNYVANVWTNPSYKSMGLSVRVVKDSKVIAPNTYQLTVNKLGDGNGIVTSSVAGIDCGTVCSASFNAGTTVTLTATTRGGIFIGWSGACSGTEDCTVTMDAAKSVTATFISGR